MLFFMHSFYVLLLHRGAAEFSASSRVVYVFCTELLCSFTLSAACFVSPVFCHFCHIFFCFAEFSFVCPDAAAVLIWWARVPTRGFLRGIECRRPAADAPAGDIFFAHSTPFSVAPLSLRIFADAIFLLHFHDAVSSPFARPPARRRVLPPPPPHTLFHALFQHQVLPLFLMMAMFFLLSTRSQADGSRCLQSPIGFTPAFSARAAAFDFFRSRLLAGFIFRHADEQPPPPPSLPRSFRRSIRHFLRFHARFCFLRVAFSSFHSSRDFFREEYWESFLHYTDFSAEILAFNIRDTWNIRE